MHILDVMQSTNYRDGKLATLSKPLDSRAKALYFFNFILFFVAGTFLLGLLVSKREMPVLAGLFFGVFIIACYIAAYRFGNKSLMSEKIFISKQVIQLIKQGMFGRVVKSYNLSDISNFRYLAKPALTDHPLAGQSFDYMGFQTEQRVINEMHGDNRIAFNWKGIAVNFGNDISSWEFEELAIILNEFTLQQQ